jgi:hypothetical protein
MRTVVLKLTEKEAGDLERVLDRDLARLRGVTKELGVVVASSVVVEEVRVVHLRAALQRAR